MRRRLEKEMKRAKQNFKPKDVGADDAADFLKKYAKSKKAKKKGK